MRRRTLFCSILMLFSVVSASPDDVRTIRVGAFNYFPGIFMDDDGVIKGFYVDTLEEIGREQNIRFEYIWGSWSEGLERIRSGDVDMLTSVAHTVERATYMDYGTVPLLTVWSELYVSVSSEIDSITAFEGKKVALMKGDFNAQNFRTLVESFHLTVEFVELPSFEDVFKAIAGNMVDGGVVNCTFGVAKHNEYDIRSTGVVFNPFDIFLTVAKGRNGDLLALMDDYLEKWKHSQSSVYNMARQKWSHGEIGSIEVMPAWVNYVAAVLILLVLLFLSFSLLLRVRVQKATKDILERERLLRESETKLRSYIANAPDGVFVVNAEGRYLEANPAAEAITGYSNTEILSMSIKDIQPPDSVEKNLEYFQNLKQRGRSNDEFQYRNKNGETRWWAVQGVKLSEDRYLGFAKDITDRINAQEKIQHLLDEKEILLKEVHHRIKNNMNTIRGLLQLQEGSLRDSPAYPAIHDAENRVQSMIVLYDRLYCSNNYRELSIKLYIESLAVEIMATFPGSDRITLDTDVDDFILNVQFLAPLGIMFNELLTNSMKHAFPGRDHGTISVSASLRNGVVTFNVRDDGTGFADVTDDQPSLGFGLQLVTMLIQQINGTFRIEKDHGSSSILEFPVS